VNRIEAIVRFPLEKEGKELPGDKEVTGCPVGKCRRAIKKEFMLIKSHHLERKFRDGPLMTNAYPAKE